MGVKRSEMLDDMAILYPKCPVASPCIPAMSPLAGHPGTRHTDKAVEIGRGEGKKDNWFRTAQCG